MTECINGFLEVGIIIFSPKNLVLTAILGVGPMVLTSGFKYWLDLLDRQMKSLRITLSLMTLLFLAIALVVIIRTGLPFPSGTQ